MIRCLLLIFLCYGCLPAIGIAQTAPKYSNEFMNIGVGARALGMSNAQVAIANDVTAGYWNPAGLLEIKNKYQFSLMHSEYFAGIAKYDYVSFATPVDNKSHIAATVIRFGVDDIPDTRFLYDANGRLDYNNIRFFSAADYGMVVSYARRSNLIKGLKLGANFKVIYRNVGDFANAWGFGLDAGAQLKIKNWHFGVMARDVTGTFNAWSHNAQLVFQTYVQTGNVIPRNSIEITLPKLIIGIAREVKFSEKFGALFAIDFVTTFDGRRNVVVQTPFVSLDPSFGMEFNYLKKIFLRGGVNNIQTIKKFDNSTYTSFQPNFGIGLVISKFSIDYALTNVGQQESLYSNVFSLRVGL
ncbi:MAG TPA: hypothetical protein DCM08_06405 [Microscillaceae bacterium]|jgi:hypothetical protein|nr:hypothetical protein [Microscillaceae bacterium]